jgi:hypothetical protein
LILLAFTELLKTQAKTSGKEETESLSTHSIAPS